VKIQQGRKRKFEEDEEKEKEERKRKGEGEGRERWRGSLLYSLPLLSLSFLPPLPYYSET